MKKFLLAILMLLPSMSYADISRIHTFLDGEILTAALLNTEFDTVFNGANDIDGSQLATNIAITTSGTMSLTGTFSATGTSNTIGNGGSDALTMNLPGGITLSSATPVTGTWSDLGSVTTIDINGGTIDGATIGSSSATTGKFTTIHTSGNIGVGTNANISFLQVRAAADKNFITQANVLLADGVALSSVNDANNANKSIEVRGTTVQLSAIGANPIQMYTNGSIRGIWDSGGNMGIGTITAAGGRLMIQGGNVGINTVNANQKLTVAGTVYSTTGGFQYPDNTTQTTANTLLLKSTTAFTTAASSGTITLTSLRPYRIVGKFQTATNGQSMNVLLNGDSGSNYQRTGTSSPAQSSLVAVSSAIANGTDCTLILDIFPTSSTNNVYVETKFLYTDSSTTTYTSVSTTTKYVGAAAITSFIVNFTGTNATGTIYTYEYGQ